MADFPVAVLPTTVFASGVNFRWQMEEGDGRCVVRFVDVWAHLTVFCFAHHPSRAVAFACSWRLMLSIPTHVRTHIHPPPKKRWAPFDPQNPDGPDSEVVYPSAPRHLG